MNPEEDEAEVIERVSLDGDDPAVPEDEDDDASGHGDTGADPEDKDPSEDGTDPGKPCPDSEALDGASTSGVAASLPTRQIVLRSEAAAAETSPLEPAAGQSTHVHFPPQLQEHLDGLTAGIEVVYQDFPQLRPDTLTDEIGSLTKRLRSAKSQERRDQLESQLEDKIWSLQNSDKTAKHEWLLRHDFSVYSLKNIKNQWWGELWITKATKVPLELETSFVKRLLCPLVMKQSRFYTGAFCTVRHYDRQSVLKETHFRRIKMIGRDTFKLEDTFGRFVTLNEKILKHCSNVSKNNVSNPIVVLQRPP